MAQFYIYLIASLPTLYFGAKPQFSYDRFLDICRGLIPDEELEVLKLLPNAGSIDFFYHGAQKTLKNFYIFETNLRNELVKERASRKKVDPVHYLRREQYAEPGLVHLAQAACRTSAAMPLDAEKMLDEERWKYLDELSIGHYFDFDSLIIYAQKLLILQRWERLRLEDKHVLLGEVLGGYFA